MIVILRCSCKVATYLILISIHGLSWWYVNRVVVLAVENEREEQRIPCVLNSMHVICLYLHLLAMVSSSI